MLHESAHLKKDQATAHNLQCLSFIKVYDGQATRSAHRCRRLAVVEAFPNSERRRHGDEHLSKAAHPSIDGRCLVVELFGGIPQGIKATTVTLSPLSCEGQFTQRSSQFAGMTGCRDSDRATTPAMRTEGIDTLSQ